MNNNFSITLNFWRWIAALLVVLNHARHLLLVDFTNVDNKNIFIKGFYFITGLGHEAVVIFFVISGYLVGGLTVGKWTENISYSEYFVARFTRIYSVLVPALIIGGGLDWLGFHFFDESEIYSNSTKNSINVVINDRLSLINFVGNILNLEGICNEIYGSNGPLWSLAYEWWYYTIYAFFLGALLHKKKSLKILNLTISLTLLILLPINLTLWMLVWLIGVSVYLYGESSLPKPSVYACIFLFILALFFSRTSHNVENFLDPEPIFKSFIRDFSFGIAFAILLLSIYKQRFKLPYANTHKFLADFSYSIYLFHFPVFIFLTAISNDLLSINSGDKQPTLKNLLFLSITCLIVYIYGYLMSRITEKYSYSLRNKIMSKIK